METLSQIASEVLRFGFNDSPQINEARIISWINEAQRQIARHVGAPEFQEKAEQVLTVGTFEYAEPSECLHILDIAYPAGERRIKPVDLQTFDTYSVSELQGSPLIYTAFKGKIWLWPTPSAADTLKIRYIKNPPVLSAAGDIPVLDKDYLHLLVEYALFRAYRGEDDPEAAQIHETQYEKDLQKYAVDQPIDDRPRQLQGTWS